MGKRWHQGEEEKGGAGRKQTNRSRTKDSGDGRKRRGSNEMSKQHRVERGSPVPIGAGQQGACAGTKEDDLEQS